MPTTTNYGWTTPADTDLVKDGASAIRTLGTAIDTTVFNNASAGIAKTIVDAKGDLIAATAADTVARLAVGANDTVLTADSSTATGLKWAAPTSSGGMTLIATTTFNNTAGTYTYSSLGTYKHLLITVSGCTNASGGIDAAAIRFNSDTGSNYMSISQGANGTSFDQLAETSVTYIRAFWRMVTNSTQANLNRGSANSWIWDYRSSQIKNTTTNTKSNQDETGRNFVNLGTWNNTAAITSLTFFTVGGSNFVDGTLNLYGVS